MWSEPVNVERPRYGLLQHNVGRDVGDVRRRSIDETLLLNFTGNKHMVLFSVQELPSLEDGRLRHEGGAKS